MIKQADGKEQLSGPLESSGWQLSKKRSVPEVGPADEAAQTCDNFRSAALEWDMSTARHAVKDMPRTPAVGKLTLSSEESGSIIHGVSNTQNRRRPNCRLRYVKLIQRLGMHFSCVFSGGDQSILFR